ncbi:MAG: putative LPS assembly protein LptD, partial [Bacteroides sp.]
ERWYEKISFAYTGQLRNSINTKDYLLLKSNLMKDWDNGMSHSIPISATFSLFKYINISPTFNYTSRWYTNKVIRSWDPTANKEIEDTKYGFNRVYNYSGSIQANTKLYGFYKPLKSIFGDKIEMIRHVFTPTVSFSAAPDFGKSRYGFWETYTYTDKNGEVRTKEYSPYSNGMFGTAPKGKQGNINFSVSNNLEMKIKSDKDSTGVRKISLIDELSAGMSYNMAAKTHQWSDLSMTLRMKLTKSYTLNLSTSFATYAYEFNKNGDVVVGDRTEWSYGRFGRFQGLGSSFSYTFNNDTWKNWFGPKEDENNKDKEEDKNIGNETEESNDA